MQRMWAQLHEQNTSMLVKRGRHRNGSAAILTSEEKEMIFRFDTS